MPNKRAAHYVVRIADQICEQIAIGKTLKQALAIVGYLAPNINAVYKWLDIHPEFREKYERARQLQADIHADDMLELGQEAIRDPKAAAGFKVAADILKWQAEVRNKVRYGKAIEENNKKALDPAKIREEIKRLEHELGIVEAKVVPLKVVNSNVKSES